MPCCSRSSPTLMLLEPRFELCDTEVLGVRHEHALQLVGVHAYSLSAAGGIDFGRVVPATQIGNVGGRLGRDPFLAKRIERFAPADARLTVFGSAPLCRLGIDNQRALVVDHLID